MTLLLLNYLIYIKVSFYFFNYFLFFSQAARPDESPNVIWIRDRPVAEVIGAEDAIYCRAVGPDGVVYYDGFGRCLIFIDRASSKHEGAWSMSVGLPGRVLTVNSSFNVTLVEAGKQVHLHTLRDC